MDLPGMAFDIYKGSILKAYLSSGPGIYNISGLKSQQDSLGACNNKWVAFFQNL